MSLEASDRWQLEKWPNFSPVPTWVKPEVCLFSVSEALMGGLVLSFPTPFLGGRGMDRYLLYIIMNTNPVLSRGLGSILAIMCCLCSSCVSCPFTHESMGT